ncbi:glutathione S-transferase C-terminal domain-containing protein [Sphingomonas sp. TWP1-3-1]|uniref:glutathione S-transferase C-terminal domain-containing protein n=1 Tax=Sphingomonas sp. TWP1-3-1 TaxID=2804612 RepID=UPI003CF1928C
MNGERPWTLLTFAPMIDSETMRLVCRWHKQEFHESDHAFGWVSILTLLRGGYGQVPLLYRDAHRLSGPRAAAAHLDTTSSQQIRLSPAGAAEAGIDADWTAYNGQLATDVAVFSYYHLLPSRSMMASFFARPVPSLEGRLTIVLYPLLQWTLSCLLGLSVARARTAERRIETVCAALDRRLADGRLFLTGSRVSLGDIALAGALSPLMRPIGHGAPLPPDAELPEPFTRLAISLRGTPVARLVERVYATITSSD